MVNCNTYSSTLYNKKLHFLHTIILVFILIFSPITFANESKVPPLPISTYGSLPDTSQVTLSPSGEKIAMVKNMKGTLVLMTFNFKTNEKRNLLQADNVDVVLNWYVWANDDVLLISAAYPKRQGLTYYTSTRLYKYDLSTDEGLRLLVKPKSSTASKMSRLSKTELEAQFQDNIISLLPEQPDKILMAIDYVIANKPTLYEVNIKTEKRKRIKSPKATYLTGLPINKAAQESAMVEMKRKCFTNYLIMKVI